MRTSFKPWFWGILSLITLVFIFSNSAKTAAESSAASRGIVDSLLSLLSLPAEKSELLTYIVRKLAHVCEFALLAFLYFNTADTASLPSPFLTAAYFALLSAIGDEFIQLYSPGRSSEVTDVMIDAAGTLLGLCFACLIRRIRRQHASKSAS